MKGGELRFIKKYFDNDADAVKELLDKYNLEMANLYSTTRTTRSRISKRGGLCRLHEKIGATYMNLQAVMWRDPPNDRPMDKEKILPTRSSATRSVNCAKKTA